MFGKMMYFIYLIIVIFLVIKFWWLILLGILLLIGYVYYRIKKSGLNAFFGAKPLSPEESEESSKIELMLFGYILNASGLSFGEQDKTFVKEMQRYFINPIDSTILSYLDEGRKSTFDVEFFCKRYIEINKNYPSKKIRLLDFLASLIFSDGVLTSEEYTCFVNIGTYLGIEKYKVSNIIQKARAIYEFKKFYEQGASRHRYEEASRDGANSYNYAYVPHDDVKNAREVLGVTEQATLKEVTRARNKLLSRYHPDKLKVHGISDEMKKVYEEKTEVINQAYDILEKYYKSKQDN
jgi:DnaJ like chaperone protein